MRRFPPFQDRSNFHPQLLALLLLLLLAPLGAFVAIWLVRFPWSGLEGLLLVALALLCTVPLTFRFLLSKPDIFEPIYMMALTVLLAFVLSPVLMLRGGFVGVQSIGLHLRSELAAVTLMAIVGLVGFYLGYGLIRRRAGRQAASGSSAPAHDDFDSSLVFRLSVLALALTVALFLLWSRISEVPLSYLNVFLESVHYTSATRVASRSVYYLWMFRRSWPLLILLAWQFAPNREWKVLLALAWLANLIVYVLAANRGTLFSLIGATLVVAYLRRRKQPSLPMMALLVAVLVLGAGFLINVRGAYVEELDLVGILETSAEDLTDRGAATGAMLISRVFPEYTAFLGPRIWNDLIIAPIPRLLWPDKPTGPEFDLRSTVSAYLSGYHAPGLVGVYYAGFGLAGPFLIMFLYGAVSAAIYSRWARSPDHPFRQIMLAGWLSMIWIIFHRGLASFWAVQAFYYLGPVLLVWYLALRGSRRRQGVDLG
jgi:oligosaccharide repeat unit polymerase